MLSEAIPWSDFLASHRRNPLLVGWRCHGSFGRVLLPEEFALNYDDTRTIDGLVVSRRVRTAVVPDRYDDVHVTVDLWTWTSSATPNEIDRAVDALEKVRRETEAAPLRVFSWNVTKEQEFLRVRLPRFIARHLTTRQAQEIVLSQLRYRTSAPDPLPTMQVSEGILSFGPEHDGATGAIRSYLERETREKAKDDVIAMSRYRYLRWLPLLFAGALLGTWAFPLALWSIAASAVVFAALIIGTLLPIREVGWRTTIRNSATVASLGFFGIGAFGIGYALCALGSDAELGHVTALGYPFLVSTSLGIAGGVFGDAPTGFARILAHIQLLLFVGGLAAAIATLLRIDRNARSRESP
jgi:hypothetical protein